MPKLEAEESDVKPIIDMVTGGNTSHYWDGSGLIGNLFQDTLGIDVYAWDIWLIYKPGVEWNGKKPPVPDFWMQQLWGVNNVPHLNSEFFANEINKYLREIRTN